LGLVKGAHTYYGWVHISVSVSYNSVGFTVKDYAYNSVPEQAILAGQTSAMVTQVQKNGATNLAGKNVEEQKNIITNFINTLSSYPNPFSNSTTISFSLTRSEKVSIKIFDMAGRLVRTLANTDMQVGTHQLSWNTKDEKGNAVSAGIYLLRFDAGTKSETKKLSVIN
jgi:flagellar hook assembly protein FlgD